MKRLWIPLFMIICISACSFLGSSVPFLDGPNVNAQKQTQESMTQQAAAQMADIQTQVAAAIAQQPAAQQPAAQDPGAAPNAAQITSTGANPGGAQPAAGANETKAAEKTAVVAKLLTAAALTPSPTAPLASNSSAPVSTPVPQIDPKASDGTDFTGAFFKAWGQWSPTSYGVSIELAGSVGSDAGKNFVMKVNGTALDKCIVPLDYPNRVYCTGKPFNGGKLPIEVYENVNGQEVLRFVTQYTFPTFTSTPTKPPKRDRATKTPKE